MMLGALLPSLANVYNRILAEELGGLLANKNGYRQPKSPQIAADLKMLLRLMRVTAPHHTWGRSPEGVSAVEEAMEEARATHARESPGVPWEKVQLTRQNQIRAQLFKTLISYSVLKMPSKCIWMAPMTPLASDLTQIPSHMVRVISIQPKLSTKQWHCCSARS